MQNPLKKIEPILLLLFISISFCVELWALNLFLNKKISGWHLVLIHLLVICLLILWNQFLYGKKVNIILSLFVLIITALFGVIGLLTSFITIFLYLFYIRKQKDLDEYFLSLHLNDNLTLEEQVYNRVSYLQDKLQVNVSTQPFWNIFNHGTVFEKQAALMKIRRYYSPEFIPFLHMALDDSENTVRVQASSIIATIRDDFVKEHNSFSTEINNHPKSYQRILNFIDFYEQNNCEMLWEAKSFYPTFETLIAKLKNIVNQHTEEFLPRICLGKLYFLMDNKQEAYNHFNKSLSNKKSLQLPGFVKMYLKMLFALSKYEEIIAFSKKYADELNTIMPEKEPIMECIKTWAAKDMMNLSFTE